MTTETIPTFDNETVEERQARWEKEKKGLISDLQKEREQRQSLEQRLGTVEKSLEDNGEEPTQQDEVTRLAADPRTYIMDVVKPYITEVGSIRVERKIERAKRWIAKQEKIDPDDIDGSDLEKDLVRIGNEHQLTTIDPEVGIQNAYKILLQERREKLEKEKEREQKIADNSSEPATRRSSSSPVSFTRDAIAKMSTAEYEAKKDQIRLAQLEGRIK